MRERTPFFFKTKKYDFQRIVADESQFPSAEEQKEIVLKMDCIRKEKTQRCYCAISKKWFDSWKRFVNYSGREKQSHSPGPINNIELIDNEEKFFRSSENHLVKLKESCVENRDFYLVPSEFWDLLIRWYGGKHDGYAPSIACHSYMEGNGIKVDLRPPILKIVYSGNATGPNLRRSEVVEFEELRISADFLDERDITSILFIHWNINPAFASCRVAESVVWLGRLGRMGFERMEFESCIREVIEDIKDGDLLILEPRYLTETFYFSRLSRYSNEEDGSKFFEKKPITTFLTTSPPEEDNVEIEEYLKNLFLEDWSVTFDENSVDYDMKKSNNGNNLICDSNNNWKSYFLFRFVKDCEYRELVIIQVRPSQEIDIDEVERREYMMGMEYDLTGVKNLKLSFQNTLGFDICFLSSFV